MGKAEDGEIMIEREEGRRVRWGLVPGKREIGRVMNTMN